MVDEPAPTVPSTAAACSVNVGSKRVQCLQAGVPVTDHWGGTHAGNSP
jgi:hypothetical protein